MVCTCCGHYGSGMGCGCGCGGYGHHWMGGRILRVVIALLVALFIFWVGVKVGELRSELGGFGGHRGYYMMGGYGASSAGGYAVPQNGLMRLVPQGGTAPTSTTGEPNIY